MAQKEIILSPSLEDHRIAKLAAMAIALHIAEAVFPSPIPGVKPGIANIITLYALQQYGFKTAAWVSLLRVFGGALLIGQFLSPTFALSLSGALASLIALYACQALPKKWFSFVGVSIIAAFAHVAGQLWVVSHWLIPTDGVRYLWPIFALSALVFGFLNGLIASYFLSKTHPNTEVHVEGR